jgi:hypothetical protein
MAIALLLGLPAAHTTCAILCATPAPAGASPDSHCGDNAVHSPAARQLSGVEPYACAHPETAALTALPIERASQVLTDGGLRSITGSADRFAPARVSAKSSPTLPPGTAPPPLTQLRTVVLRV